jgi:hypothetical protein
MGENPNEIEREIEVQRDQLGRSVGNLRQKLREMRDWRYQFSTNPGLFVGCAFAAGFLFSLSLPNGHLENGRANQRTSVSSQRWSDAWETMKAGLIGVATSRIKDLVSEAIPGFREECDRAANRDQRSMPHQPL